MLLLLLFESALGWVTLSQARLGAQLYDIREQTRGNHTSVPPLQKLQSGGTTHSPPA